MKKTRDWSKENKVIFYRIKNIFDTTNKNVYIGSTTNWSVRKYQHKLRCNSPDDRGYNYPVYRYIRGQGGFQFFVMEKLEERICHTANECNSRELYLIELHNAKLNTLKPLEY